MGAELSELGNPSPLSNNVALGALIEEDASNWVNFAELRADESIREGDWQRFQTILLPHHGRYRRALTSSHIQDVIRASRRILELPDNWDENGSPRYEERTWNIATTFVKRVALDYWTHEHVWVNPPRILPGPDGSIDIHWRTRIRELLINIPPSSPETPGGYYGSGGTTDTIKGKLQLSLSNEWILAWLLR